MNTKKIISLAAVFALGIIVLPALSFADKGGNAHFTRTLGRGHSGSDVSRLQQFLAQDRDVYPQGLVTGTFGPLTQSAVMNFQRKHGLETVGIVGPKTRALLESLLENLSISSSTGTSVSRNIQPGNGDNKHGDDQGESSLQGSTTVSVSHSDSESDNEDGNGHGHRGSVESDKHGQLKVVLCHNGTTISIAIPALWAHLKQGDTIGSCGTTTPPPPGTEPVISGISASPAITTASVMWLTDEPATSLVWYATSSPVLSANPLTSATAAGLTTNHNVGLSGLLPSTLYHYIVVSTDSSNRTATSSDNTFTTSATVTDTTPPIIFAVGAGAGVNTATVTWMTNESANGRLWYATSSPAETAPNTHTAFDATFGTTHSFSLSGLMSNTQYFFTVVSTDPSGNTATSTSSLYTFTTLPFSLSSVSVTPASTTATVLWQTNASADSTVWYSTSTPVVSDPLHFTAHNSALLTSHSLGLSGLATSTTYHFIVVSRDGTGDIATSSESAFTTLAF